MGNDRPKITTVTESKEIITNNYRNRLDITAREKFGNINTTKRPKQQLKITDKLESGSNCPQGQRNRGGNTSEPLLMN